MSAQTRESGREADLFQSQDHGSETILCPAEQWHRRCKVHGYDPRHAPAVRFRCLTELGPFQTQVYGADLFRSGRRRGSRLSGQFSGLRAPQPAHLFPFSSSQWKNANPEAITDSKLRCVFDHVTGLEPVAEAQSSVSSTADISQPVSSFPLFSRQSGSLICSA